MNSNDEKINLSDLSSARKEMMDALNTFLSHVRYTITLMSAVLAGGVAIVSYAIDHSLVLVKIVGIAVLLILPVISEASAKIVRRYYKIYASNYIYSARLHIKHDGVPHPWVSDLREKQNLIDISDENAVEQFIEAHKSDEKHSWFYYKNFIRAFGVAGVISGVIAIFVCANA